MSSPGSTTAAAGPATPPAVALSVVVPVYNGAATVAELVARLVPVLDARAPRSAEILLVNDGSADASWQVIRDLAAREPRVRGIDLLRNYGQHNALLCGIRAAAGSVIVTMDDDLQHPPEELPKLLDALTADIDVVYGTPLDEQHGLLRDLASQATKMVLQGAMGAKIARQVSAFRALRGELVPAFTQYDNPYVSIDVLLTWATTRYAAVAVRHDPRRAGVSNYTLPMLARHALNMVTGFSVGPLQLASFVGFGSTLLGLAVLAYVVGRYLIQGTSVPGFPFLASVIAIFSGAQLFTLGILGEYLARMHSRLMSRPVYSVRRTTTTTTSPGADAVAGEPS